MKLTIISLIAVATLSLTTGCVTVKREGEPRTHSTTTTTEQTTLSRPHSSAVETQTVRTY